MNEKEMMRFAAWLAAGYGASAVEVLGHRPKRSRDRVTGVKLRLWKRSRGDGSAVRLAIGDAAPSARFAELIDRVTESVATGHVTLVTIPPHVPILSPSALGEVLAAMDLAPTFCGWTPGPEPALLAILDPQQMATAPSTPPDFRVIAFLRTFNEDDIIDHTLRYLTDQQIDVYVIDGWSTDRTYELVTDWLGRGVIGCERFPGEGAIGYHTQIALFRRIERLAQTLAADWYIHHDADERRTSPWTGVNLRDGLYRVDQLGFNAVDHTVIEFPLTRLPAASPGDVVDQLEHFLFSDDPSHFVQRKAWRAQPERVRLADSAGHDVTFPGRRVFPYKFLLRHYPVRSQQHGSRKLVTERQARLNPFEAARRWSVHYQAVGPDTQFALDATGLDRYDEHRFNEQYCAERLSGIGACDRRWHVTGAPTFRFEQQTTVRSWSRARLAARPDREPRLDPLRARHGALTLDWDTGDGTVGAVFVQRDDEPEQLFQGGAAGRKQAEWIAAGIPYVFRLYSDQDRSALHAELTAHWRVE